jgi:hypothetical protein
VPILGFTIFALSKTVNGSQTLTSSRAFSALAVFSLLTEAVAMFIEAVFEMVNAVACFERYHNYLSQKDHSQR